MKNPSSRTRANGAYVIKSAESRPLAIKAATTARHGRSSAATSQDKKLIAAVRQRHKAA